MDRAVADEDIDEDAAALLTRVLNMLAEISGRLDRLTALLDEPAGPVAPVRMRLVVDNSRSPAFP
jgi:hypothetical protein